MLIPKYTLAAACADLLEETVPFGRSFPQNLQFNELSALSERRQSETCGRPSFFDATTLETEGISAWFHYQPPCVIALQSQHDSLEMAHGTQRK